MRTSNEKPRWKQRGFSFVGFNCPSFPCGARFWCCKYLRVRFSERCILLVEAGTMQAYKIEAEIDKNGTLTLGDLPFAEGEAVEIIILSRAPNLQDAQNCSLRGTPVQYRQPFEAVAENEWDAVR